MFHRRPGLWRDWSSAIIFEKTDLDAPDRSFLSPAHLDRRGTRVSVVPTGHNFEQGSQVFYGARHRPDHTDQGKGATGFWKVSGRGNSSGSRLQAADAAEVRRDADRTAAVTAHAASGKSRGNGGGLSAARSTRGPGHIPGIVGAAIKKVVALPGHEQFGRVGDAEDHGSGGAQACDQRGVGSGDVSGAQTRTGFTKMSGHINRRLDGNRHTMQRPEIVSAQDRFLCFPCLGKDSFRLVINESVQRGIQARNAIEVSARHLHRRNFFAADLRCDFPRGKKWRVGRHGVRTQGNSGYLGTLKKAGARRPRLSSWLCARINFSLRLRVRRRGKPRLYSRYA